MSTMNEKNEVVTREGKLPLTDTMMEKAAGGKIYYPGDGKQDSPEKVAFVYSVGDRVEVKQSIFGNTKRGTIINRYVFCYETELGANEFYPTYTVAYDDGDEDCRIYQNKISY